MDSGRLYPELKLCFRYGGQTIIPVSWLVCSSCFVVVTFALWNFGMCSILTFVIAHMLEADISKHFLTMLG